MDPREDRPLTLEFEPVTPGRSTSKVVSPDTHIAGKVLSRYAREFLKDRVYYSVGVKCATLKKNVGANTIF